MFTMTTERDFLAYLGDDEYGNKYLSIFTLLTPVSICGVPFVGKMLDKYGFHAGLQTVNLLGCLYQIIKISSQNLNVQVAGFVIFSFFRSFFFGVTFSFLPSLLSSDMVGKATGLMYAIGAAFSFINIPMAALAVKKYEGNFFIPNLVYTILIVPCVAVAWGLGRYIQKEDRAVRNGENPSAPLGEKPLNQAH
jgi:MFS family permease